MRKTYFFNKIKLEQVLHDFHTLTKVKVSVFDVNFNQVLFYPKTMTPLCAQIKSTPNGYRNCRESDKQSCLRALKQDSPYIFTCHAGLLDVATPIYCDHELIGYMMFGQLRDKEKKYVNPEKIVTLCKQYNLSKQEVMTQYENLAVLDEEQIQAAANLLHICASYLYLKQIIKIEKNKLVSEIDNYINDHLDRQISIQELCQNFRLPKNRLYTLFHNYFDTGVQEYILLKRVDQAKDLLTTTDLPISEISTLVGISDYNYFIRMFKRKTNDTPLAFRKHFPHEIL